MVARALEAIAPETVPPPTNWSKAELANMRGGMIGDGADLRRQSGDDFSS